MKVLSLCSQVESVHIGEVQILKMWLKGHSLKIIRSDTGTAARPRGVHTNKAPNTQWIINAEESQYCTHVTLCSRFKLFFKNSLQDTIPMGLPQKAHFLKNAAWWLVEGSRALFSPAGLSFPDFPLSELETSPPGIKRPKHAYPPTNFLLLVQQSLGAAWLEPSRGLWLSTTVTSVSEWDFLFSKSSDQRQHLLVWQVIYVSRQIFRCTTIGLGYVT